MLWEKKIDKNILIRQIIKSRMANHGKKVMDLAV